jgi:hypothetical protein
MYAKTINNNISLTAKVQKYLKSIIKNEKIYITPTFLPTFINAFNALSRWF